jgi:hypothetical protein
VSLTLSQTQRPAAATTTTRQQKTRCKNHQQQQQPAAAAATTTTASNEDKAKSLGMAPNKRKRNRAENRKRRETSKILVPEKGDLISIMST